jgi:SAM-dependent methyltransferase
MRKTPMTPEDLARRHGEIVGQRGPWTSDNLRLTRTLYTIAENAEGDAVRVRRVVQIVTDLAAPRVKGLRILDLACGEGGVALELGKQGAEVVALEASPALAEKAEFARDALRLSRVTVVRGDVRRLTPEEHGYFDVVLALGVLDRLDAPAIFDAVRRLASVCKGFALVEARLTGRPRVTETYDGMRLRGAARREPRSAANASCFVLARASFLELLTRYGFSSIVETLDPHAVEDAPWFAAFKGRRVALLTSPQANALPAARWEAAPARGSRIGIPRILRRGTG